jgi:hypothetical protein
MKALQRMSLLIKKGITWPIEKGEFRVITTNDCKELFPYGIYKAAINGNAKAFRFNPKGYYTHFDLESARLCQVIRSKDRIVKYCAL